MRIQRIKFRLKNYYWMWQQGRLTLRSLLGSEPPIELSVTKNFDSAGFRTTTIRGNPVVYPALTDPALVAPADATWLHDDLTVLGVEQNGEARAYPVFQAMVHHVINDTIGGAPYLVTY